MDTTFKSPDSRHDVHRVACLDCHPKGVPKKRMESLYPPDKSNIPGGNAGVPAEQSEDKLNELILPEGRRP